MGDTDLHYLCNENVVVYKRKNSRTNCWYARVKLAHNNRWKKFTTRTEDLNEALKFAETQFSVLKELINHGVAVDTRRFSHVADLVIKEMEDQLKAGTGKVIFKDYIRAIYRYKDFFGKRYLKINLDKGKTGKRVIIARHNVRRYLERVKDRFEHLKSRKLGEMKDVDEFVFRLCDGSQPTDLHGAFEIMLTKAGLLNDANGRKRSLYSLRHTYATFQILYSKIDLHLLSKNMGTSIAMLEKHYSHLDVLHRADILAGRSDQIRGRKRNKETKIIELDSEVSSSHAEVISSDALERNY